MQKYNMSQEQGEEEAVYFMDHRKETPRKQEEILKAYAAHLLPLTRAKLLQSQETHELVPQDCRDTARSNHNDYYLSFYVMKLSKTNARIILKYE